MNNKQHKITLGIDIGTTSVKMCLIDQNNKIIHNKSLSYKFDNDLCSSSSPSSSPSSPSIYSQQNVSVIFNSLQECLSSFESDLRSRITQIGVCGQMHGCVLWESNDAWQYHDDHSNYSIDQTKISDLYTWQDKRCSPEFISKLPKPQSYIDYISTGFGCATIFWLLKNQPNFIKRFHYAGTIMDLFVVIICDLLNVVMSCHNASSWGYFDPINQTWNKELYV